MPFPVDRLVTGDLLVEGGFIKVESIEDGLVVFKGGEKNLGDAEDPVEAIVPGDLLATIFLVPEIVEEETTAKCLPVGGVDIIGDRLQDVLESRSIPLPVDPKWSATRRAKVPVIIKTSMSIT